ncbi:hypothetical protein D9611_011377 [Ephemerocybe angulata]|uniref:non-specific serine/threonine protein kinase n=1 Tax=Ephemerocybe angulata TaxID=980116 RepID=A0A8H5F1H8_9AGAR|nr:hypothetical protein D9611_011377 [Tulosesus angulatus]
MDSTEELQQNEITVLKSIYADDFIECAPPKAWKGAARLHEFIIRITNPEYPDKVSLDLHVKFPKTYPALACATFTIQKPAKGLSSDQISRLQQYINGEAQKERGTEMVFTIVTSCQEWLIKHASPAKEVSGSLAIQMNKRALDEEKAKRQREAEEAAREQERREQEAKELEAQIEADAWRQHLAREQQYKSRKRANSETTEVPFMSDTPLETFGHEILIEGVHFNTVKLFHPRKSGLETIYLAEPVCEDLKQIMPLELHIYTFESSYYSTSQGRKKLKHAEEEIKELTAIRHDNLVTVFAVKLNLPHSSDPPQLIILMEQPPPVTLFDVLNDSHSLREERASQYLSQILLGLNALHNRDLVHRGINAKCIGLSTARDNPAQKIIKLGKAVFHTHLLDLHRSNSFGPHVPPVSDEPPIGDGWLSRDVKNESSLLYTRRRDIHSVGIVLLQMLMGLDVVERFSDVEAAIHASSISPALSRQATTMLVDTKKNGISCMSLLSELAQSNASEETYRTPLTSRTLPVSMSARSGRWQDTTVAHNGMDPRTPVPNMFYGSPELEYFAGRSMRKPHASRWKDDWEELELLGKGAFGSVVKARNKIDNRIYAVKKVKLKTEKNDTKIMREVNALSRLNHRFIVRYYTTWIETVEAPSATASDDSSAENSTASGGTSDSEDATTSVPRTINTADERFLPINGGFGLDFDVDDFDDLSGSQTSFPSIRFGEGSQSPEGSDSEGEGDGDEGDEGSLHRTLFTHEFSETGMGTPTDGVMPMTRTLYIQMEFVERQTLKERVDEGISEDEAWRLFHQIVDALVHMTNLGILHRDIKLTNIFIDAKGDCKIGDFGLATSSLAAVDPSDVSLSVTNAIDGEMTLEVGTRLYIAPEIQTRGRGRAPRNHSKADLYSLGVVFFEMNYRFSTGSERIAVLENLRKPGIFFPTSWEPHRTRQKEIITWLLQHDPDKRPTAIDLSQSPLLPPRVEDEYFNQALTMMAKPDTPHHQAVLSMLFNQPTKVSRGFLYDKDLERPEYLSLTDAVRERLATIFKLHGAVDIEPPLLMPVVDREEEKNHATFIDRTGNLVTLPRDLLVPFARLAAKSNVTRIKRYHITNVFRPNPVAGHPLIHKAAVFDIITQDLEHGPVAAGAEVIAVMNNILNSYPNLSQTYNIQISHSTIVELALGRIVPEQRNAVVEILTQSKSSLLQKRTLLMKKGLTRGLVDELEVLNEPEDDVEEVVIKLEKLSSSLLPLIRSALAELKGTIQHAGWAGVDRPIIVHPLMLGSVHSNFRDGMILEVVHKAKPRDVLAVGGRYDHLISRSLPLKVQHPGILPPSLMKVESPIAPSLTRMPSTSSLNNAGAAAPFGLCAMGLQVSLERILVQLALFQSSYVKNLIKEERSFGYWSPRRCDVYLVSYHKGYLQERMEVVANLWAHGISADLMYESTIGDVEYERVESLCEREGILFTVCPRPRMSKGSQAAFKVKSILNGTEYDVSRAELVGWLQHHITEQKRIDLQTSGAQTTQDGPPLHQDTSVSHGNEVQLILPADIKKQRRHVKHLLSDRAFETANQVKASVQGGMPTIAVDVPTVVFDTMCRSSAWLTEEEVWKSVVGAFPTGQAGYAAQMREAFARRRGEGWGWVLVFGVKEERMGLAPLN